MTSRLGKCRRPRVRIPSAAFSFPAYSCGRASCLVFAHRGRGRRCRPLRPLSHRARARSREPSSWSSSTLKASNGLHAHLENSEDGTVTLEIRKEGQIVTYEVPGEATEGGLKARFGRLGLIDVAFTPTATLNSTEPGADCTGAPRTLREGVFAGTIDFTGEREFVRIEGPQATGSMSVISRWECPEAEGDGLRLPMFHACWRRPPGTGRAKGNRRRCLQGVAVARATSSPASPIATAAGRASSWVSR